ncbi:MAG: hypothetical protein K9J30_09010 [Bacteroidales bacterium]|nr:hypothetical protein [Bacteroidales bacterium]
MISCKLPLFFGFFIISVVLPGSDFDLSSEVFQEGEKWDIKNAIGEVILEAKYDNFMTMTHEDLDTGDRIVTELDGKWGILKIDGPGTWIVEPGYDFIGYPNQITHMIKGDKWRIMDIVKKEVLVDDCDSVDNNMGFCFSNGVGFFEKNGKHGVMMEWGQHTDAVFDDIDFNHHEWVKVQYNGKRGYINKQNEFAEDEEAVFYRPVEN